MEHRFGIGQCLNETRAIFEVETLDQSGSDLLRGSIDDAWNRTDPARGVHVVESDRLRRRRRCANFYGRLGQAGAQAIEDPVILKAATESSGNLPRPFGTTRHIMTAERRNTPPDRRLRSTRRGEQSPDPRHHSAPAQKGPAFQQHNLVLSQPVLS